MPSNYEIVVHAKKIIGSAQARRKNAVLQHGSFPLCGDLTRITRALNYPDEQSRDDASTSLLAYATTAEMVLGKQISWQDAVQAFIIAFQTKLNLELVQSELSEYEISCSKMLVQEKYTHHSWLERI